MRMIGLIGVFTLSIACVNVQRSGPVGEIENKKIKALFEREFEEHVRSKPSFATSIGRKEGYDRLDDISEEFENRRYARIREYLQELSTIRYTFLGDEEKVSYELFKYLYDRTIEGEKWRYHEYPVTQMWSYHTEVITLLTNRHLIETIKDAEDYIARLNDFPRFFRQAIAALKIRKDKGLIAPRFTLVNCIGDTRNLMMGAPFDKSGKDSVLWRDFKEKVAKLNVSENERNRLVGIAEQALLNSVVPSLKEFSAYLENLRRISPIEGGAWRLPRGFAFYDFSLRGRTTTNLTADEIHQIGLDEVTRIQKEIHQILLSMGVTTNSWREIHNWMRQNPKFYYTNDDEGRKNFLADSQSVIANMQNRLGEAFSVFPKSRLEVRAVEPYREKSAGLAFYELPSSDGRVPGIYYVNLGNMAGANRYEMEALAYHEGIPGHHMQIAIAQERQDLPDFRKFTWLSAFGEGWGLYAEQLGKEMGMYKDPVFDLGRLTMELWRAARLVVDTGLHAKKWSYKKTKDYLLQNTPEVESEIDSSVQRYLVLPGQATAYKIGMLKILEWRQNAKAQLGDRFSLRSFHDEVLRQGSLPLSLAEKQVSLWVLRQKRL